MLTKQRLAGAAFCITGRLSCKRSVAHRQIIQAGGCIHSAVSQKTNYLVVGNQGKETVKRHAARSLGVEVIDEARLCELLQLSTLMDGCESDRPVRGEPLWPLLMKPKVDSNEIAHAIQLAERAFE